MTKLCSLAVAVAALASGITACSSSSMDDVSATEGRAASATLAAGTGGSGGSSCYYSSDGGVSILHVEFRDGYFAPNGPGLYAGTTDTRLESLHPNTNYGTSVDMIAKRDKSPLFRFDLTAIPSGKTVVCAYFGYYVQDPSIRSFPVYEVKRPWTETDATWNLYAPGAAWGSPGATSGSDIGSTPIGEVTGATNWRREAALDLFVVQNWIDNPAQNHGFIVANSAANDGINIASSETPDVNLRPGLSITYLP